MARWLDVLVEYDYKLVCWPGLQHKKANALSRRPFECKGCMFTVLQEKSRVSVTVETGEKAEELRFVSFPGVESVENLVGLITWKKGTQVGCGSGEKPSWGEVSHWCQESRLYVLAGPVYR